MYIYIYMYTHVYNIIWLYKQLYTCVTSNCISLLVCTELSFFAQELQPLPKAPDFTRTATAPKMANGRDDPGLVKIPDFMARAHIFIISFPTQAQLHLSNRFTTCSNSQPHAFQHSNLLQQAHIIPTFQWRNQLSNTQHWTGARVMRAKCS